MPEIKVVTYPNGEERVMVKLVGHTGISHRPVYEDAEGELWVKDLSDDEPWYYPKINEQIDWCTEGV